jgi:hypothetical protein
VAERLEGDVAVVRRLEVGPADRLSAILDAGRADTRGVEM